MSVQKILQGRVPIDPQTVDAPLTRSATFLVVTIADTHKAVETVRSVLSSIDRLSKNVSVRDLGASFSCTVGIGNDAWDRVTRLPRPEELHPFRVVRGEKHTAVSTPGDLLFHIRAERRDLCFEFERQLLESLGDAVAVVDDTEGFRYFDVRDLLGFVDGTANPVGQDVPESTLVTAREDAAVVGGSYVVVQKYMHNMAAWERLSTEQQEAVIGRKKLDNVEIASPPEGKQQPHKSLAFVQDDKGKVHEILRDNMPFGSPGSEQFGTYFIGYSKELWVIERMLQRMFVGHPPGLYDKLLDFSTPLTGVAFFAPSADLLRKL
ncbi:Dyp-type peroxidase [Hypoxylon sp. FL1284]|nr:Dyp-type peroxidase [Hypoxylon sp. FL1284]